MPIFTLTLYKETALPKLTTFLQECEALQTRTLTAAPWVPISSEYSRQTLQDLISFLKELTQHNNLDYWKKQKQLDLIDKLHQQFTGKLYKFVPACFDQLSYEMSNLYLKFLNNLNFKEDLTKATKAFFWGKNLEKMLLFVKDNTQQSRQLFEFATASPNNLQDKHVTKSLEELFALTESQLNALSSEHNSSEVTRLMQEYEIQAKKLLHIFLQQPLSKIYLYGCNGSLACTSRGTPVMLGQIVGAIPMQLRAGRMNVTNSVFASVGIFPGLQGVLLQFLLSKERRLFDQAKEKGYQGDLLSFGMLNEIKHTFNYEDCDKRTEALKALASQLKQKLQNYINTTRPFISTDENKKLIAQNIIDLMQEMDNDLNKERFFLYYNAMLGKLLSMFLQSSLDHNNLIKDDNLSHGDLGMILTQSLKELFVIVSDISIYNNSFIFDEALKKDEWELYSQQLNFRCDAKKEHTPPCTTLSTTVTRNPWAARTPGEKEKIKQTLLNRYLPSAWTIVWHNRLLNHSIRQLVPKEILETVEPQKDRRLLYNQG